MSFAVSLHKEGHIHFHIHSPIDYDLVDTLVGNEAGWTEFRVSARAKYQLGQHVTRHVRDGLHSHLFGPPFLRLLLSTV